MPRLNDAPTLFSQIKPKPAAIPAEDEWVYAHCDGGARGNPGPAGFGALIQDKDGKVIAELSEFLGIRTNNFAEYSGLLSCLQYALEHQHSRLKVVSDSELMVKQILGKYRVKSPDLKPLYDEAKRRISQLNAFEISHALRHKNKVADRLANEAMDKGMNRSRQIAAPPLQKANPTPLEPAPIPISIVENRRVAIPPQASTSPTMLRGFTRNGAIHILGGATLPDGVFVKIIPE